MEQVPAPERRKSNLLRTVAIIFIVLILICGGVVTWVVLNIKSWTADMIRGPLVMAIRDANLPEDQTDRIVNTMENISDAFEAGELGFTEFQAIFMQLQESHLLDVMVVEGVRMQYSAKVQTPEEQAAEAMKAFDRFERGLIEESITTTQFQQAMEILGINISAGDTAALENVTGEQLKSFVDRIREMSNDADVPDEPYTVDFAGLMEQALADAGHEALLATRPAEEVETEPAMETEETTEPAETPETEPAS